MRVAEIAERARKLEEPFCIAKGKRFRLKDIDPGNTLWLSAADKPRAREALATGVQALVQLQERLYAQNSWSLLLIFQAMDAAGKDGAIKHVMSGVNPQGCQVHSFKAPSSGDLDHDFLWRCVKCLPSRGQIGIFNRSYYEEVLVVRLHSELLQAQRLPPTLVRKAIWQERYEDIRAFERHLTRNGVIIRKFFLHVSKEEQRRRFLQRLSDPHRHWKFSAADLRARRSWDDYMEVYEDMIRHTATRDAPWYVVPADHKWFTRVVVAAAIIGALAPLNLKFPEVSPAQKRQLAQARRELDRD